MIYFTSDFHFGHDKDFIYKARGYNSVFEHDKDIIEKYNSLITDEDIVYILGDVYMNDEVHGVDCLSKLKGQKYIIRGNHDSDAKCNTYKDYATILGYASQIKYGKLNLYLSHYPTMTANYDEKHFSEHIICLSGHTHYKEKFYNDNPFIYNVCLDAHGNLPISIDEIIKDCRNKFQEIHDGVVKGL